ncbi:MAG: hypothetical protein HYY78_05325 [Betaproteobacteria bacterium]|nr:hypothetical protein [Betaproteobacteria bacterium]
MSKRPRGWALTVAMTAFLSGPSLAADELSKDLTSTIALLGLPCGQVVSAKRLGENDYIATCSNKMRYRVFMNAQGRVVAQRQ